MNAWYAHCDSRSMKVEGCSVCNQPNCVFVKRNTFRYFQHDLLPALQLSCCSSPKPQSTNSSLLSTRIRIKHSLRSTCGSGRTAGPDGKDWRQRTPKCWLAPSTWCPRRTRTRISRPTWPSKFLCLRIFDRTLLDKIYTLSASSSVTQYINRIEKFVTSSWYLANLLLGSSSFVILDLSGLEKNFTTKLTA